MRSIRRHYLDVDGRRVHYRRSGEGPPLVMLHGSPGDSEMLGAEMNAAGQRFTCLALDTPGFGGSDPLPGDVLTVTDLARATASAMVSLGLPPCRIYGTHTGAAIALEMGVGWPDLLTGLVLEGVPMFSDREAARLFEGYFAPMIPDPLGGHLTSTWMRFRDQFTWFPWLSRDVIRLNPVDRPTPEDIDHWVGMFYRSCKTYGPAYKAACHYGQRAYEAAGALRLPAVYMCGAEDMLFGHLDRLPPLAADQGIARLPHDPPAKYAAIAAFAAALPGGSEVPPPSDLVLAAGDPAMGFINAPLGQVFVRAYGRDAHPAVILLHDGLATGRALDGLARCLMGHAYVIVPDLPGSGRSDAPPEDHPILTAGADALDAIADSLGLKRFAVAAVGSSAAVAATHGARADPRLSAILLEDVPAPDETTASAIAPEIRLSPTGAHWLKAWLMLRDNEIYHPWFDGRVVAQRRTQGNFDANWLHDQTVALMASRTSYHRLPRAAARFDVFEALAGVPTPTRVAESGGLAALILSNLPKNGHAP